MTEADRAPVGVLALQGDVPEHAAAVAALVGAKRVRSVLEPADLSGLGALLLPGGESTTLSRLLDESGLRGPLIDAGRGGLPLLGTCAGIMLLAREHEPSPGGKDPLPLGLLSVRVRRNDYGRQAESFEAPIPFPDLPGGPFPGAFIRAPRILSVAPPARVLAELKGHPVAVREGSVWGLTFHPELSGDLRLHRLFLASAGLLP